MLKPKKTRKPSEELFTRNHDHAFKYRKRVQQDKETQKQLKEFNADESLQDSIRRDNL